MANRRRRRRRRTRRRGGAPVGLILGIVIAVLALGGAGLAVSQGAFENLGAQDTNALTGVSASSARFKGAQGIDVGVVEPPSYWWANLAGEMTVDTATEVDLDPNDSFETQYQRVLVPADLLFAADSSELSESAKDAVAAIAESVSDDSVKIIVVCHSSSDGSVQNRLLLSEQRADELASLLEELLDRSPNSILRIGRGDTEPLPGIDQSTSSGRALNRRCEIFIQLP